MVCRDMVSIRVEGKGLYENFLDETGREYESLNGVALTDGCYCKHYRRARDWSDKTALDKSGRPAMQHFCAKNGVFMGWAYCCGTSAKCYEAGRSAGVKRILNRIRKRRMEE